MFHLMTHAFFKALLFMAAGSIIAAMANDQNIDEMSGFGKAMRVHLDHDALRRPGAGRLPRHLGLLLQGRDPRLRRPRAAACTRSSPSLGYVGALLTAIYTFRLVFRVLPGEPCKEAQELIDTGHVAHDEPVNPATGEEEDTDVGFPGAEHHIAEQSGPMRVAMGVLAFLALFGGLVQVPGRRRRRSPSSSTRSSPTRR